MRLQNFLMKLTLSLLFLLIPSGGYATNGDLQPYLSKGGSQSENGIKSTVVKPKDLKKFLGGKISVDLSNNGKLAKDLLLTAITANESALLPAKLPKGAILGLTLERITEEPLTDTTYARFIQTVNEIEVYGTLVVIEVDSKSGAVLNLAFHLAAPSILPPKSACSPSKCFSAVQATLEKDLDKQLGILGDKDNDKRMLYFEASSQVWHNAIHLTVDTSDLRSDDIETRSPDYETFDLIIDTDDLSVIVFQSQRKS